MNRLPQKIKRVGVPPVMFQGSKLSLRLSSSTLGHGEFDEEVARAIKRSDDFEM